MHLNATKQTYELSFKSGCFNEALCEDDLPSPFISISNTMKLLTEYTLRGKTDGVVFPQYYQPFTAECAEWPVYAHGLCKLCASL